LSFCLILRRINIEIAKFILSLIKMIIDSVRGALKDAGITGKKVKQLKDRATKVPYMNRQGQIVERLVIKKFTDIERLSQLGVNTSKLSKAIDFVLSGDPNSVTLPQAEEYRDIVIRFFNLGFSDKIPVQANSEILLKQAGFKGAFKAAPDSSGYTGQLISCRIPINWPSNVPEAFDTVVKLQPLCYSINLTSLYLFDFDSQGRPILDTHDVVTSGAGTSSGKISVPGKAILSSSGIYVSYATVAELVKALYYHSLCFSKSGYARLTELMIYKGISLSDIVIYFNEAVLAGTIIYFKSTNYGFNSNTIAAVDTYYLSSVTANVKSNTYGFVATPNEVDVIPLLDVFTYVRKKVVTL
jgi:hypothetical protein